MYVVREVDDPHAAAPDLTTNLVVADPGARREQAFAVVCRRTAGVHEVSGVDDEGCIEEAVRTSMRIQQRFHFCADVVVLSREARLPVACV
jgi:hypothetical protein